MMEKTQAKPLTAAQQRQRDKKRRTWLRTGVQLFFFVSMPGAFVAGFSGVKQIFLHIGAGEVLSVDSFTLSQQPQQPQYQQPQAPKEPSAFGLAIKGLPQLWLSYCKDPIGTTRKAVEKHDFLSGILMAAVTYIAVFFATLVYALRLDSHFPAVAWLGASLLMPVAGFGLTLLTTLVLTKVAKVPSDFKGMLASSGLGMTFPATLAAGSIVLLLVYPGLISLLGVASFAVWAVVTVGTLLQVYGVKLNLVTILLCVAFCIAGYYVVSGLRDWFLHACYSYDINDVLSGLGDLFG